MTSVAPLPLVFHSSTPLEPAVLAAAAKNRVPFTSVSLSGTPRLFVPRNEPTTTVPAEVPSVRQSWLDVVVTCAVK